MKILFYYESQSFDYLSSLILNQFIFDGKHDVFSNKFPHNFFKSNKKSHPAYGCGHTVYYKLDDNLKKNINILNEDEISQKLSDKVFDLIFYLNPEIFNNSAQTNLAHFKNVIQNYKKEEIFLIDGHDHQLVNIHFAKKVNYYKRELIPKYKNYCKPISFSFPSYFNFTNDLNEIEFIKKNTFRFNHSIKNNILAANDPRFSNSYIFENEFDYYQQYSRSLFATTIRKGGWDCMRHYEILKNNCLPYFPNIDKKPITTMIDYPVELQAKVNKFFKKLIQHDDNYFVEYNFFVRQLNHHFLNKKQNNKISSYSFYETYENLSSEFMDWFREYGYSKNYYKIFNM